MFVAPPYRVKSQKRLSGWLNRKRLFPQEVHRSDLWTKIVFLEIVKGTMLVIMRMILDILAQIIRTLWAHKLRSFLTMFGVAWGVGSLLLLVGLGEGSVRETSVRWPNSGKTSCLSSLVVPPWSQPA